VYKKNTSKPKLESYRIAEQIATEEIEHDSDISLKEYYSKLMDQLEIEGIPKQKISAVGQQLVIEKKEQKLKSKGMSTDNVTIGTWWFVVAREKGCTDPNLGRPKLNNETKEKPKTNFELENIKTITVIDNMMEFLKSEKQFLKHNPHDIKLEKNLLSQNIYTMTNAITHANERFNNKLKIAPSHYHILFEQFMESMSSHLSVPYYLHVREKETFTAKQAGKIIKANVKDMPFEYEPKDQTESKACNFSGEQCPNCKFFRTEVTMRIEQYQELDKKGNKVIKSRGIRQIHCFKEDADYDAPKINLPANEISESDW